jgi:hypothetical protein
MKSADVLEHLLSADMVIICMYGRTLIAFASIMAFEELLFLHGMAVNIAHQGSGIGKGMLQKGIGASAKCRYIALTTQNPYMYSLAASFCGRIFPNHSNILPDCEMINRIDTVISKLSIELSSCQAGKCLIKNWYSKCLYNRIPGLEESAVFKNNLRVRHWRSCDALFLFGEIKR